MTTKIFSSRVDEQKLAYADTITQRELGISFGQYCGSNIVDYIFEHNTLPKMDKLKPRKKAFDTLRQLAASPHKKNPSIAHLDDAEIRELIAKRYEN